jgi:tripartite-type tricarboxylate transporter receptor subunit TctC
MLIRLGIVVSAALALCGVSHAQTPGDVFKGKQIRLVIGSAAGSDNDLWGRLFAQHVVRYLPGAPTMLLEHMPGAGQLIATNYMFNNAPRDGSVIGMISRSMPSAAVTNVPNVRFEPTRFNWLGSPEVSNLVMYVNQAAKIDDLRDLRSRALVVGATSKGQGITIGPTMLKNLLRIPFKMVLGYRAPADLALAAGRGEIEAFANTIPGATGSKRPWVESGQMRILFNFEPERIAGLDVPSVFEIIDDPDDRKVMAFFAMNSSLGRPLVLPPGTPPALVAAWRRAIDTAFRDPALIKDAAAMGLEIAPQRGEQIADLVAGIVATAPDIVARAEHVGRD